MCYPCTHCGRCREAVKPGTCVSCGHVNDEGAERCASCGTLLPPPPGVKRRNARKKETEPR